MKVVLFCSYFGSRRIDKIQTWLNPGGLLASHTVTLVSPRPELFTTSAGSKLPSADSSGYVDLEPILEAVRAADIVVFDGLSLEFVFRAMVPAGDAAKTIFILDPGSSGSAQIAAEFRSLVIDDLGRAIASFEGATEEEKAAHRSVGQAVARRIREHVAVALKPVPTESTGPDLEALVLFFDQVEEKKNQRYYRHVEYLAGQGKPIAVLGCDFTRSAAWDEVLAGKRPLGLEELQRSALHGTEAWGMPALGLGTTGLRGLRPVKIAAAIFESSRTALGRRRAKVCFAHSIWAASAALMLRDAGLVDRVVFCDLDYYPGFYKDHRLESWVLEGMEKRAAARCDATSSVSSDLVERRKRQGARQAACFPNGAAPQAREVKEREPGLMVYSGTLDEWSGLDVTIEAMALASKAGVGTRLLVIGEAWKDSGYQGRLEQLCAGLNIASQVRFVGSLPYAEMVTHLQGAKIGIISNRPSDLRRYSCPLKVFDYAANGLPILCTDLGDMGRLVRRFDAGCAVSFSAETFAEAMRSLLSDEEHWGRCAKGAVRLAQEHTWDKVFSAEEKWVQQAIGADGAERESRVPSAGPVDLHRAFGRVPSSLLGLERAWRRAGALFGAWRKAQSLGDENWLGASAVAEGAFAWAYPAGAARARLRPHLEVFLPRAGSRGGQVDFGKARDLARGTGSLELRVGGKVPRDLIFSLADENGTLSSVRLSVWRKAGLWAPSQFSIPLQAFHGIGEAFAPGSRRFRGFRIDKVQGARFWLNSEEDMDEKGAQKPVSLKVKSITLARA